MADVGFVIPPGNTPDFLPALKRLCGDESVDVVVPLVDEEILSTLELEMNGIHVLAPRKAFVEICLDKYQLVQGLQAQGIVAPKTCLASAAWDNLEFPLVIKPRVGRGSRGFAVVKAADELDKILRESPYALNQLILQQFIAGEEFTVSVVVWRDGEVRAVVPKKVIVKKGITQLAVTRRHEGIIQLCHRIQDQLRADGPFNVQLRLDERTGEPLPFEINPRFSTTVTLTTACGVDEVGGLIELSMGRNTSACGFWREGLMLMRHMQDVFMDEAQWAEYDLRDYSGSVVD